MFDYVLKLMVLLLYFHPLRKKTELVLLMEKRIIPTSLQPSQDKFSSTVFPRAVRAQHKAHASVELTV